MKDINLDLSKVPLTFFHKWVNAPGDLIITFDIIKMAMGKDYEQCTIADLPRVMSALTRELAALTEDTNLAASIARKQLDDESE